MAFDRFLILWLLWLLFFSTGLSFVFTGQLENSFSIFFLCFNLVFGGFQAPLSFDICGMIICAGHFFWAQFCKNCLNGPFFICVVSKFLLWWNIYSLICFHLWPHHSCRSFVDGLNLVILFLWCLQAFFPFPIWGSILGFVLLLIWFRHFFWNQLCKNFSNGPIWHFVKIWVSFILGMTTLYFFIELIFQLLVVFETSFLLSVLSPFKDFYFAQI